MDESDNSWVFDSLVCFLNGPVWNAPLQSFIEEKSLIFEENTEDNNDYQKIFEEYKNLVDVMLGSYMEDIGITPTQFEEACNKGHLGLLPKHFDNNLFEQIWAANDYAMFKQMMIQRNVELQLQALELIEQKYGIMPQSFIPHKSDKKNETTAEIAENHRSNELEENIMEEVIKKFPFDDIDNEQPHSSKDVDEEVQYLIEEKHILQQTLKNIEKNSKSKSSDKPQESREETVRSSEKSLNIDSAINNPTPSEIAFDKKPIATEIDRVELKKRQEYLKAQRDKLVALKKEARKKHLNDDSKSDDKLKNRPKSSKVAEAVMAGQSTNIEHQDLQVRKSLAERLRSEVINNKNEN